MSTTTTTLARTLADAYEVAMRDRAMAEGAYLETCLTWHGAYVTGTWGSVATLAREAGWGNNTRKVQGILMLGLLVSEHGVPDAATVSGIEEADGVEAVPALLDVERAVKATLAHGGKGSADRIREAIEDADTYEDAARALVKGKPSRKASKPATETGTEGAGEGNDDGTETAPEAPKARGNGALIADALANIERVDPETLTEAETLALASLIQAVAALGKAYQTRQAAA
jgi:hypothetical protein